LNLAKLYADRVSKGDAIAAGKVSSLCQDALQLYNSDLRRPSGFGIRDIGRFCKPILLNVVATEEHDKSEASAEIQTIIEAAKGTPEHFLRSLKSLVGESVTDVSRLHDDIETCGHGLRKFLTDNSMLIVGIIAVLLTAAQLVLTLSRP